MKIAIGGDHAGYAYKNLIAEMLRSEGHEVVDYGPESDQSCDYPDHAHPVAAAVESGQCLMGVLICGSANGVAMTANKHQGVRAALCWIQEIALLARQHNDANIICLPARYTSAEQCKAMVKAFISTPFEGGRHEGRVKKIKC